MNKINVYDNKKLFSNMLKNQESDKKSNSELIAKSNLWAEYLQTAAEELTKHGIILFIYPTGFFRNEADESLQDYIRKNKNIIKYYKDHKDIKINTNEDKFIDDFTKLSFITYLATNEDQLYLIHNLPTKEDRTIVADIFKKIYESNYKWNKSDSSSIFILMKGAKKIREKSFQQILMVKLKKDLGNNFKINQKGTNFVQKDDNGDFSPKLKHITIINFETDDKILSKKLVQYGFKKHNTGKKSRLLSLYTIDDEKIVLEDEFKIDPVKKELYLNFSRGLNGTIYNKLVD